MISDINGWQIVRLQAKTGGQWPNWQSWQCRIQQHNTRILWTHKRHPIATGKLWEVWYEYFRKSDHAMWRIPLRLQQTPTNCTVTALLELAPTSTCSHNIESDNTCFKLNDNTATLNINTGLLKKGIWVTWRYNDYQHTSANKQVYKNISKDVSCLLLQNAKFPRQLKFI